MKNNLQAVIQWLRATKIRSMLGFVILYTMAVSLVDAIMILIRLKSFEWTDVGIAIVVGAIFTAFIALYKV